MAERRDVIILGSTGSIGRQALDVIERNPERFRVVGLSAGGGQPDLLADQARRHGVADVALGEAESAELAGRPCDVVLNGLAGAAGLLPTLRALEAGSALALANKESLIIGGPLVRERARPGQIRPVDSEHSALAQCLMAGTHDEVSRLILTASGGPFRGWSRERLATVTPEQALDHPTWSMGPLVTINSSTLVNKGLEVIEAHLLFDVPLDRIDVVVHPQSIVHSMVEFTDAAVIAQLSMPDMRLPIAYALGFPGRGQVPYGRIDWTSLSRLDFQTPDRKTFRCLDLAYQAGRIGGTAPAWLSAANEVAVEAFLAGATSWWSIADIIEETLQHHDAQLPTTVEDILQADETARRVAREVLDK